jgi:DNA polymerase I-like protein with 3'-5' exonuclease and polymerase domains
LQRDAGLAVARMQTRGLLLDREKHAGQVEEWSRELAEARHAYHEATGKVPPSTDNEVRAWLETVITPEQRRYWPSTDDQFASVYHRAWSGRERFAKECQARGYIVVPTSGRIIQKQWFKYGKLTNRQCFNSPVQGSCADALLRAVALIDTLLVEGQIRGGLIACVHDELLLEVHEDDAEIARALLEDVMVDAFATTFPGAPTKGVAIAAIGQNWAEAKQ